MSVSIIATRVSDIRMNVPMSCSVLGAFLWLTSSFCCAQSPEPPIGVLEGVPRVSWKDAKAVEGQECLVYGQVVEIVNKGRVHLMKFDSDGAPCFHGVVFQENLKDFPLPLETTYLKRSVELRGLVLDYGGVPQIRLNSPSQIRVIDELPTLPGRRVRDVVAKDHIVVASYNILNLFDEVDDQFYADEGTPAKSRDQLKALASVITLIDADVLALQEVESRGYLRRFVQAFLPEAGYENVAFVPGNDRRSSNVALLSRFPIGRVTTNQHLEFSDAKGVRQKFQRDVLEVQVLPPDAPPLDVWVLHLKSSHDGREHASVIREAEAKEIRQLLDQRMRAEASARIIVCGDFNDTWDSPSVRAIVGEGSLQLKSSFEDVAISERITYNREPYRSMIDFLLISPALQELYVQGSFHVWQETPAAEASDHNAISLAIKKQ